MILLESKIVIKYYLNTFVHSIHFFQIGVVEVSAGKDKTFFPQKSAQAEVAVVKIDRNSGNDKDDQNGDSKSNGSSSNVNAEASVGSAQAGVWGGIGGGVEAGVDTCSLI